MSKSKVRRPLPPRRPPPPSPEAGATLQRAMSLHRRGGLAEAEPLYRAVLSRAPEHFTALHMLGVLEAQRHNNALAVELIGRALQQNPNSAPALANLGIALRQLKRQEEAIASFDRALAIQPDFPSALNSRGNALLDLRRYDEALASFERALALKPDYFEAAKRRADTLFHLKRYEDAVASFEAALALQPDDVQALTNRGIALRMLKRHDEAIASYDRSLAINPQVPETLNNRGNALLDVGRYRAAIEDFDRVLAIKPDFAEALNNRGLALGNLRRHAEAAETYERLLAIKPDYEYLRGSILHAKLHCCDWANYRQDVDRVVDDVLIGNRSASPFAMLSISGSPVAQLRCAQQYNRDKYAASAAPVWRGERYRHDKIRVAYLSADLRGHAVSYLTAGLFEAHDRSRFETAAISFGASADDETTTRLRGAFDRFIDVRRDSDRDVALLLRRMEIDIAVDLMGYTKDYRMGIFAWRGAPIQVSFLGHPGTTGAPYIDYILADRFVIPEERRTDYSENVVYLPDTFQPRDRKLAIADHTPTRSEAGLPDSGFVFCSFNNSYKIAPDVFGVWMRLLHQIEGSVLWLLGENPAAVDNLRRHAAARGVAPERLIFAPRLKLPEHLARHRLADLFLDTLPYNAGTMASDALWAGLPILTCAGESFAARMAGSVLGAVGLPELVTGNLADYEALALALARDPHRLAAIREKLGRNRETCPLFDTDRFCRHLESAYETMWQRSQRGEPPASFAIAQAAGAEAPADAKEAPTVGPDDAQALNDRGIRLFHDGRYEEALASFDAVLAVQPDHVPALGNRGIALRRLNRPLEALASLERALVLNPDYAEAFNSRGNVLRDLRRHDEAIASFDRALAIKPDQAGVLNNRGDALVALGRHEEAVASYSRAVEIRPDYREALNSRGNALLELKRPAEAIASYERVLQIVPHDTEALNNRGIAFSQLKRHEEAVASYDRVLAINPRDARVHNNRGNALLDLRRHEEAIASYDRALAIVGDYPEALNNRGIALRQINRHQEALASFARVLALRPDDIEAINNRGNALRELKQFEEAIQEFEKLLSLKPDYEYIRGNVLSLRLHCCIWDGHEQAVASIEDRVMNGERAATPFTMLTVSGAARAHLRCAQTFDRHKYAGAGPAIWRGERYRHDRVRVAYLSADFHSHATAFLMAGLFEAHNRSRFETIAISFGPDRDDPARKRLVNAFSRFLDVRGKSDQAVALLLRQLEIDIAVDLKGYTHDCRPGILALRPVPVQVNFLGYPGTMGTDNIDYILADRIVIPEDQHSFYSEKVVYLPDSYQPNDAKRPIGERTPTRAAVGLPETGFVFCSFNNNFKISPPVFDVWMRLLHRVEGSVLWLLEDNPVAGRNLRGEAEKRGIAPGRLVFAPRAGLEDHLARHRHADLFLDTLPYNAHTTASDALWVGLPVLTCRGSSFAGRVASSLLHAAGLPELIADNLADYEALALELARDDQRLASIRAKLARNRATCPLFDTDRFRRNLERAYETMWERYQRGEPPASFAVGPEPATAGEAS